MASNGIMFGGEIWAMFGDHWELKLLKACLTNNSHLLLIPITPDCLLGGACGVMVIVTGYGHGDTSSIPGQDWLHFT